MSNSLIPIFLIFILIIIVSGVVFYSSSIKDMFEIKRKLSIDNLKKAIGLSIENGKGVHLSLGKSDLNNFHGAASLIGLETLEEIINQSVLSDNPPVTTGGSGDVVLLAQGKHQKFNYDSSISSDVPSTAYLSGATNLSYISGAIPHASDEKLSTQVLVGNIGPEIGLIIDTANKKNHFTLPATDNLEGQSISYLYSKDALIGEEIFGIPGQLSNKKVLKISYLLHDLLRWLIILMIFGAIFLKLIGLI